MSTRILLSGTLAGAAVRRKRKADGALFAVATVKDVDRTEVRLWKMFINDPALIEQVEEMRVGEPIAITGPFSVALSTGRHEPELEYRITAEAILDTKRKRKSKTKKGAEERITSDEDDLAPRFDAREVAFDDPLPF